MGIGLTASESTRTFIFLVGPLNILRMAGADEAELREAFKLFDTGGDGVITMEELKGLISKVGGDMSEAEAIAFAEFGKLWAALHGAEENKIRGEFAKLDVDKSGYITKEEMLGVISSEFQGDKMAEAQAAIDKLDVNGDGKVSYPEFILVMKFKK